MEGVIGAGSQSQLVNPYQLFPTLACLLTTFQDRDTIKTYDGYKVLRVNVSTEREFESLKTIFLSEDYDFWSPPSMMGPTDIMIAPEQEEILISYLNFLGIHSFEYLYQNLNDNVAYEKYNSITKDVGTMNWNSYQTVDTIHGWMDSMAEQYPALVTVFNYGNSSEGRRMKVMKISTAGPSSAKPAVWLDGGIHAREWISPATVTYMANELLKQATRLRVSRLVDSLDWYIAPLLNPDGYAYTMSAVRIVSGEKLDLIQKDKSLVEFLDAAEGLIPTGTGITSGEVKMRKGTSKNQCSPIFHGVKASSEPEVESTQNFIMDRKDQIKLFLTFHSYSQILLLPWAYDKIRTDDHDDLMAVGQRAIAALEAVSGTKYTVGPTAEILYAAAGGSFDWAKAVVGVKYAYGFELRDSGRFGFLLPPNQIIPTGKETFAAVKSMAEDMMKIYRTTPIHFSGSNSTHELFEIQTK